MENRPVFHGYENTRNENYKESFAYSLEIENVWSEIEKETREGGNYNDVLPLKAVRRDSISNLTPCRASNVSCRQTQCHFI